MNQPLDDKLLDKYLDEWAKQFVDKNPCEGDFQDAYPDLGSGIRECFIGSAAAQPVIWSSGTFIEQSMHVQLNAPSNEFMCLNPTPLLVSLASQQGTASVLATDTVKRTTTDLHDEDFKFESGVVVLEDRSRPENKIKKSVDPNRLKCTQSGCKYRGTFGRSYELKRHMDKHNQKEEYQCPVQGCDSAFYRTDKFRRHLQQSHSINEPAICPQTICGAGPYPLHLLAVHASKYHYVRSAPPARQALEWLYLDNRRCLVPSCKWWGNVSSIQEHIRKHSIGERGESEEDIRKAGYDLSGNIICPICEEKASSVLEFEGHLDLHLVTNVMHLQACRLATLGLYMGPSTTLAWISWKINWEITREISQGSSIFEALFDRVECTFCGVPLVHPGGVDRVDHHLGLLQDPATIRPFRLQLLELLGSRFSSHPVFDDLKPKV